MGLMIGMEALWTLGWSREVTATDASMTGWGVAVSRWDQSAVAACGRLNEKRRFKCLAAREAQRHALVEVDVSLKEVLPEIDAEDVWVETEGFQEVPSDLLDFGRWKVRAWNHWRRSEGILMLEARALIYGLTLRAMSGEFAGCRLLILNDNLAVVCAFARRRVKKFNLLNQVRKLSGLCLRFGFKVAIRWIPSERNAADEPSRIVKQIASTRSCRDQVGSRRTSRWTPCCSPVM